MKMKRSAIFTLIILLICLTGWTSAPLLTAKNGIVMLHNWNFTKNGTVSLKGEWDFYWKVDKPSDVSFKKHVVMDIPSTWDDGTGFPSSGYGLYHLRLKGLKAGKSYGLKIPTMSNSYRFWLNDQLLLTNGIPGKTKQSTKPYYKPQEVFFEAKKTTVDLYLGVSNFHYRSGGMWESLELGTPDQISGLAKKKLAMETILFGSLTLSGLYHLVLYVFRKKEKILLLFGITCLVISGRLLVIGEQPILQFFQMPWELLIKIEYLAFYIVVPLFSWFMNGLYKEEISKLFCKSLTVVSIPFCLLVLFTPAIIYTKSLFLYQIITIITLVYILAALLLATHRNREGAKVVLTCAAFYAFTVINDILYNNRTIDSTNLSSFGLFVFVFSQSYIIAKSTANAFQKVEEYSLELTDLNRTLEDKIYERTKSLEASKQELQRINEVLKEMSYHDPLTNLPNRRYFDDLYEKEWEKALLEQSEISILFFDIDHFKFYNDSYGHQQGDITLKLVAKRLQKTLEKHGGTVARIGGEEFIGLIKNKSAEETNQIAERCRTDVKDLQIPHPDSITAPFVTISIGVATNIPTSSESKRKLIRTADEALYYAKEEGRNQVKLSLGTKAQAPV